MSETSGNYGFHGRCLIVDLSSGEHTVETIDGSVFKQFLGGYGLGAWLMWKHFPPGTDPLAAEACFVIVSGLLTGTKTPFSGRIQIVGKSPLTHTWADSNSGGSVASHLRRAGYDALLVKGRAAEPSIIVIKDDEIAIEPAGDIWGKQVPDAFDALTKKYGSKRDVGVSAIGPAGERQSRMASVLNDRYHAFGRQGFGAIYGSKNLKAVVVGGSGEVPVADPKEFKRLSDAVNKEYKKDVNIFMRMFAWVAQGKGWLGWLYRLMPRLGAKIQSPTAAMRRAWSKRGTTLAVAFSVENGDGPIKNWAGVAARDFPIRTKGMKVDGDAVDKMKKKKLSCGDCPMPCKGIVQVKSRNLTDVRRPDYETLVGFGSNLLNDDIELVVACHDACNRYGFDAVSSSAVLGWVAEAVEKGLLTAEDLDGIDMRWGDGEAALALTIKIGEGEGCGEWLQHGVKYASEHVGKGTEKFAVHVHGQEPPYHDPRFSGLMGVSFVADPTPARHTSGGAAWNESFGAGFSLPQAVPKKEQSVKWKGYEGKGKTQAHYSNGHQVLNGLGLCMFTYLTGGLPWTEMVNALTGWGFDQAELLACGERIQNMRNAFNRREGIKPSDFQIHERMSGTGEGLLDKGPLRGVTVPLLEMRNDYMNAMQWDTETGKVKASRAKELGIDEVLEGHLA